MNYPYKWFNASGSIIRSLVFAFRDRSRKFVKIFHIPENGGHGFSNRPETMGRPGKKYPRDAPGTGFPGMVYLQVNCPSLMLR
jgi:hypothetical protein